jgi:suppressor of G2 allele of SKP1
LTKKSEKKEGEDGEEDGYDSDEADPVNGFFKKLYKDADEDTRRAMMKSFTESGGTALSTNWAEVGSKKVEISPPGRFSCLM